MCQHVSIFFLIFGLAFDGASVPVVVVLLTLDFLHVNVNVSIYMCKYSLAFGRLVLILRFPWWWFSQLSISST